LRITPRSAALAVLAAVNVFAVLAVGLLPGALADSPAESSPAQDLSTVGQPVLMADLFTPEPTPTVQPSPTPTATPTPTPTPSPTPKPTPKPKPKPKPTPIPDTVAGARQYVKNVIGIKQYNCIDYVWTRESKWNPLAGKVTGAYGIPQAFPGSKMATFGANWRTSPLTQVKWGIWYVNTRYGSACAAYQFWIGHGWY
jgi:hypothetical protein